MNPRLAGLGGTFVGIADDQNAVYTNPAGLGFAYGWNIDIGNLLLDLPQDPIGTYNRYRKAITDIRSALDRNATSEVTTALQSLVPSRLDISLGLLPIPLLNFATSRFGLATLSQLKVLSRFVDVNSPTIQIELLADAAAYLAYAHPMTPQLSIGGDVKYLFRASSFDPVRQDNRLDLVTTNYLSAGGLSYGYYTASGLSYDLGALYRFNHVTRPQIGIVFQNLGGTLTGQVTRARASNSSNPPATTEAFSTTLPQTVTVGVSVRPLRTLGNLGPLANFVVGVDYKVSNPGVTELGRNLNIGMELPARPLSLRMGVHDGYITYGLSADLGFIHLDYAFFTEEVGETLGLVPASTHVIQGSMSFVGITHEPPKVKEEKKKEPAKPVPTPSPTLVLAIPEGERVTTKESMSIRGVVQNVNNLRGILLNGVTMEVWASGSFEAVSPLALGKNRFRAVAVDTKGTHVLTAEVSAARITSFPDVPTTYWVWQPVTYLATVGIMSGYPDGTFQPEKPLTRAELSAILVRSLGIKLEAPSSSEVGSFKDVGPSSWAFGFVEAARKMKLIEGYPDGTFAPNTPLKRVEAIAVLARFDHIVKQTAPATAEANPFTDLSSTHWALSAVSAARKSGWLSYIEGTSFGPDRPFTRAEATHILFRTEQLRPRLEDTFGPTYLGIRPPNL